MELIELGLIVIAFIVFVPLAFVVAKYQDIYWRVKLFRKTFKRNLYILERVSKDGKTRTARMINLDGDTFDVGNYKWVVKNARIYRKDKESAGFKVSKNNIAWEEGVPIITVDEDSIKPLDFYKEDATIRPEELGSTLSAWVMNQLAKGFAMIKNQDLWLKLIAVGVLINLLMAYTTMDGVGKIQNALKSQAAPTTGTVVPEGGTLSGNGSIVIKGSGVK